MKTDAERGPIGAWARASRVAAGYTSAEHAVRAARDQGLTITVAYLRGIEAGSNKPGRGKIEDLARFYRVTPPPPAGARSTLSDETLAAIRDAVAEAIAQALPEALAQVRDEARRR